MNKLLIGLLIVAAGTGAFLLLRKKDNTGTNKIKKEWIIGKWKIQAPDPVIDTSFQSYVYNFQENGTLLQAMSDSVKADTLHYEWNKANELVWKEKKEDSVARVFRVDLLTQDSLQVSSADSVKVLMLRVK